MRNTQFIVMLFFCSLELVGQSNQDDTAIDPGYFITADKEQYLKKLEALPAGIKVTDAVPTILKKLEALLTNFEVDKGTYPDDVYAKESNWQALKSIKEGGYGIGAVLIDPSGKIIAAAHNEQIQKHRSDLHGEMTLLTRFEESPNSKPFLNVYLYKPGMTVFSSAEPCPMCFIRLASAGVDTKYCTPGPDDGMVNRVSCLPSSWQELASKHSFLKGSCSPTMQKLAHLLFFSFLLDNRGPK
jgi:tRNA(Arg) A34 adenosine deaminase TadA